MRRLRNAFRMGIEGEERDRNNARLHRVAWGIGRLRSANRGEKQGPNEGQFSQYLELLSDIAIGANKPAIEAIQTSSELLGMHTDDPVVLKASKKPHEFKWKVGFHAGESKAPKNKKMTPLIDLPPLIIDGKTIPVDNVTISTSTMVLDGRFTSPETTLTINSRPAPDNNPSGVSADTLSINIFSDGNIVFQRGNPASRESLLPEVDGENLQFSVAGANVQNSHYDLLTPADSNVETFIEGIAESVARTAEAYAGVRQMGPQNFVS